MDTFAVHVVDGVATATSYTGTLYFGDKNVTFSESGVYEVTARSCSTASNAGCTTIAGINRLTMNGTIRVSLVNNHILQAGDSIRLWSAATMTGTPKLELPSGVEWDTSRLSEGLLFVVSISDGIAHVTVSPQHPADIHDLSGRLIRKHATSMEGLPGGIYVVRGRKVVVK